MHLKIIKKFLLKLVVYSLILFIVTKIFNKYFYIDTSIYGIWIIMSSIIINILNKTIKPIIFKLTLPITAITYGLFYPMINVFILYITSLLLRNHFMIHNILVCFVIAIIISVSKYVIENLVLKLVIRKG